MFKRLVFGSALLSAGLVTGAPALDADLEPRAVNCALVSTVINNFTKYTSSASSFCSAYLQTTISTAATLEVTSTRSTTTSLAAVTVSTTTTKYLLAFSIGLLG